MTHWPLIARLDPAIGKFHCLRVTPASIVRVLAIEDPRKHVLCLVQLSWWKLCADIELSSRQKSVQINHRRASRAEKIQLTENYVCSIFSSIGFWWKLCADIVDMNSRQKSFQISHRRVSRAEEIQLA